MEFELNGTAYRTSPLNVFDQLRVARKLLPLLGEALAERPLQQPAEDDPQDFSRTIAGIAHALAAMSDEDVNAILHPCLAVVSRRQSRGWAPVFRTGELMFTDIDLMTLLQLAGRVIEENLGNFLPATPDPAAQTTTAPD